MFAPLLKKKLGLKFMHMDTCLIRNFYVIVSSLKILSLSQNL